MKRTNEPEGGTCAQAVAAAHLSLAVEEWLVSTRLGEATDEEPKR
jgi:hypothetical protein